MTSDRTIFQYGDLTFTAETWCRSVEGGPSALPVWRHPYSKGGTKLLKGGTKLLKGGTKLLKGGTKLLKGGTKSLGWATGGGGRTTPPTPPPGYGPDNYTNNLTTLFECMGHVRVLIPWMLWEIIIRPAKCADWWRVSSNRKHPFVAGTGISAGRFCKTYVVFNTWFQHEVNHIHNPDFVMCIVKGILWLWLNCWLFSRKCKKGMAGPEWFIYQYR